MMRRQRFFNVISALLVFAPAIWAQDYVTRDFKDVQARAMALLAKNAARDILLVFDIDNTLLAMNQDLGSNQWFEWQRQLKDCEAGKIKDLMKIQGWLYALSGMHPPQRDLPEIFKQLKAAGFPMLALTSRGNAYRSSAERELDNHGYVFAAVPVPLKGGDVGPCIGEDRNAAFLNGIFMTGGRNKGEMLDCLLKQAAASYKVVIMVDDSKNNLLDIEAKVKIDGLDVETFLYNAEDGNVARFEKNPKDAVIAEFEKLEKLLKEILR